MPELPEVETVARGLDCVLCGRSIAKAELRTKSIYRAGSLPVDTLVGGEITAIERFGKAILFRFEDLQSETGAACVPSCKSPRGTAMVIHLGMTGNLIVPGEGRDSAGNEKHLHAVFLFAGGGELKYYDPRRFGYLFVGSAVGLEKTLNIGPDPFQIKPRALAGILEKRRAPVKSLLLNQRIVSGLGNIYVDEALFSAGIHPLTQGSRAAGRAGELLRNIRAVLRQAIRHGGTTFRDYRKHDGSSGSFQRRLAVYGREGERCRKCNGKIKRIVLGGRSTHFCPRCQKRRPARVRVG